MLIPIFFFTDAVNAEKCTKSSISHHPGRWLEGPASFGFAPKELTPAKRKAVVAKLKPLAGMFHDVFPRPMGYEAKSFVSISHYGIVGMDSSYGGKVQYSYHTNYLPWFCNESTGIPEILPETFASADVIFNSVRPFIEKQGELLMKGKKVTVYHLAERIGSFRGQTLYDVFTMGQGIVYSMPGRLPWKPVTRKQYLESILITLANEKSDFDTRDDEFERNIKNQIADLRKNRNLTDEMNARIISGMQQELDSYRKKKPSEREKLFKIIEEQKGKAREYLSSHSAAELGEPAYILGNTNSVYQGFAENEQQQPHMLVFLNENYFDANVSHDVVQSVAITWSGDRNDPISAKWLEVFERRFPFEKIRDMLGH